MFAGELPADILDDVARHMTGAFDYILFKVTEEGVTLKPYVEEDGENTLSQAVTIPVSDWDTFELTDEIGYVCAVDPYTGLYKAIGGTETLVLRNPAREELDVASLNYHSFTNIDSAY